MMGSARRTEQWVRLARLPSMMMVPGTGLEPVTFGCLRHFEVYRAHLLPLQVVL